MTMPLNVLLIEDSEDDAELLVHELRRGGYEPFHRRVDTAAALTAALRDGDWDVVTCDYVMPQFSALAALRIIKRSGLDLPVIIVSGQVGEEVAVTAMRAGAHDFVSKHRLTRLVPAIERELVETRERSGRRRAEATLLESEDRHRELVESLHDVVFEVGSDERLTYVSPTIATMCGAPAEAYVGRPFRALVHPDDLPAVLNSLERTLAGSREPLVYRVVDPHGGVHWVRTSTRPIFDAHGKWRALRGVMTDVTDQVEAEQSYRTIFERSVNGLAVVQGDRIQLANPALAAITGRSLAELTSTPVDVLNEKLVHPDDVEEQRRQTRRFLDGHHGDDPFAFRIVLPNGAVRHVVGRRADFSYRGAPARLVTFVDDTERWHAEEAYRTIFEGAIHGMVLIQGDRIIMANPAISDMMPLPGTVIDQPLYDVIAGMIYPDDVEQLHTHLRRWLAIGEIPPRLSFRVRRGDGTEGLLYVQTSIVTHRGGPAVLVAVADLTDRWRAEEAYRAVFERSMEGLLVISGPHVLMANQAAADVSGYAIDELTRMPTPDLLARLLHADDRAALEAALHALPNGAKRVDRREVRLRRRDGTERQALSACAPMTFAGRPAMLFGFLDITERWQAEAAVRDLNAELEARVAERTAALQATAQELEAFSYSASHDLRAPLRSIDGFCQALIQDHGDILPADVRGHLDRVLAAAADMGALIDQLLVLSRATSGELRRQSVDLTALARDAAADATRGELEGRVRVVIEDGLRVDADATLVRALLDNLVGNAVKFSSAQTQAHITIGATGDGARAYFVRDNGVGFDPAQAERLFRPFQRLHSPSQFTGHGIGLATVSRIVARHGGRVWAEGSVGEGATFYFTLE
jgi:PAS domain S-box-containing protein